ncbi:MAG: LuxR C-terminal-related transcriptional regulator [Muribaculaceae bacterium]|nr:LuxR C-terminal-related transcriptional regulator [Muribaculaceae bacterium]
MDILRKELNGIYESQHLADEQLPRNEVNRCREVAHGVMTATDGCTVITDASCDRSYLYIGNLGRLLGVTTGNNESITLNSSDEDLIYNRIHPEDLVDKRMLEYEFFRFIDRPGNRENLHYRATCRLRMKNRMGEYVTVDNSTQLIAPSPAGKMWLILCCYVLSPDQSRQDGIAPHIINNHSGEIISVSFDRRREAILSKREKEILNLIKEGKPSKHIANTLNISIHTVNRHRQNILSKLSVGNSHEAVMAAEAMKLL